MSLFAVAVLCLPAFVAAADREYAKALATVADANDLGMKFEQSKSFRLIKPFGVAIDGSGRLFVADPGHRGVVVYDTQGQQAKRWGGTAELPLLGPAALAVDEAGRLFVADIYKSQVVVFDRDGKVVSSAGRGLLRRPGGIAVDSTRSRLYVADMGLGQVIPFDLKTLSAGKAIASVDGAKTAPGSVAVNSSGNIYVSDLKSCKVQVFNPDGTFQRNFTTGCTNPNESFRPLAIGRDDLVYVADPARNTVEVFDANGTPVSSTRYGKADTPAFSRTGMAIGADGRLYLSERGSHDGRVQIFQVAPIRRKK